MLPAGEALARICSAASRVSQALSLQETSYRERSPQTYRIAFVQEQPPRLLGEDVCEICGRNNAVPGLGDFVCWDCY